MILSHGSSTKCNVKCYGMLLVFYSALNVENVVEHFPTICLYSDIWHLVYYYYYFMCVCFKFYFRRERIQNLTVDEYVLMQLASHDWWSIRYGTLLHILNQKASNLQVSRIWQLQSGSKFSGLLCNITYLMSNCIKLVLVVILPHHQSLKEINVRLTKRFTHLTL